MLRRYLIKTLTPFVWKCSNLRQLEALQEFALIEKDSGCQILSAIESIKDAGLKALLFQHVLEEFHHSDLFNELCAATASKPLATPIFTRFALTDFERVNILSVLAYIHVGERAVNKDFKAYAKAAGLDSRIGRVFTAVGKDEDRHEQTSMDVLLKLADGDRGLASRALLKSFLIHSYRTYIAAVRCIGEWQLTLLLGILYFLSGAIFYKSFRQRLAMPRDEQLKIFVRRLEALRGAVQLITSR